MHIVVVDLKGGIATVSCEPHHVIIVVVDLDSDFSKWKIVRANVEHYEDVAFDLRTEFESTASLTSSDRNSHNF